MSQQQAIIENGLLIKNIKSSLEIDQSIQYDCYCIMTQLSKTLCYCRETSTDILSSLHHMIIFQPHKKKKMVTACPPMPKPVNAYLRKNRAVNQEVCHFYSFQQVIVSEDIYAFYPINLLTLLVHPDHTKLEWIQHNR